MSAGIAYAKRYGAGFTDGDNSKPVDQTFLNAVEAALLQLIGSAPTADGQVAQWDFANTRFGPALLLNKNIDPAAAIAKSKLDFTGANGIVNADIAGAAAIAKSKLAALGIVNADIDPAAAIAISKLASYPADGTKSLRGDASWQQHAPLRKVTPKQVLNSVAETDLLNGEFALTAGQFGIDRCARLNAWGDYVNNSGGARIAQQFKLKLGTTTLIDTGVPVGLAEGAGATRFGWRVTATVMNLGVANSQVVYFDAIVTAQDNGAAAGLNSAFATGEGTVSNGETAANTYTQVVYSGYNATAVDTTAALVLSLPVINPTATATYDTTLKGAILEIF